MQVVTGIISAADEAEVLWEQYGDSVQLLLTDIVMPGGSGRQLADKLVGKAPKLRVLFMTGYAPDELIRGADGSTAIIQKPFTGDELLGKIRGLLADRTRQKACESAAS